MTGNGTPSKDTTLFIALPVVGLLFLGLPWEPEIRAEAPVKRLERLNSARDSFLTGFVAGVASQFKAQSYDPNWNGLFPWEEAARKKLDAQLRVPNRRAELKVDDLPYERFGPHMDPRDAMQLVMSKQGNPNVVLRDGRTPLTYTVEEGSRREPEAIQRDVSALLENGADPNGKDQSGRTPLVALIRRCDTASKIAELKQCTDDRFNRGCHPYDSQAVEAQAAERRLAGIALTLLSKGASVDLSVSRGPDESSGQKEMTTLEYAEGRCADAVLDALKKARR